jgi:hypothetical protein
MPPWGRRSKRRRELWTPQPGDRLWIPGSDPKGFRPAMEGTSGAVYRAPFREEAREAALERRARASDLVGSAIRRLVRRFAGELVAGASKSTSRPTPSAKLQPSVSRARDTGCPGRCWVGAKPSLASDRFEGRHADGETSSCAAPGPVPPGWPRTAERRSGATREQKLLAWATGRVVRGVRTVRGRARRSSRIAEVVRATRGSSQPRCDSQEHPKENHGSRLALPRESIGKAKQRRKPERGGKVARSVAGSEISQGIC